ncbi:MAG TPA: thiamine pyrophosphate-binding protein [Candidatus Acidoferrales bacterium]|jgi:acetolactate synthase-1/2/3 large subunit|nr:thiamine pyrophosphate-binding protein [Candidatus Acidoferrales bacterium]
MNEKNPSRRNFMAPIAKGAAAGAAVAGAISPGRLFAASMPIPSIRIPKEVTETVSEPTRLGSFEGQGMTGAEVFARACKDENLAALFCCPGNYPVIQAISAAGIPAYGGRSEGSMTSAADGFSRVTGEVTACSGTEGPGFTNMIMNIAVAHRARTPLLVLASNVTLATDDREYFIQTGYQQPTTEGLKKYGKRLIDPKRVHEYAAYAFRYLKTGVPGPVHLDFPGEIVRARFTDASQLTDYYGKEKYRTESRPHPAPKDMAKALDMIGKAERPVIVAGQGVFLRKAWDALMTAAEKNDIAVVSSGPMRGHFPDEHRLSASLSTDALMSADLVIFVGQYSMPARNEYKFNPDVKAIRVNPTAEDLGRNWPLDLGIVADEAAFLELLAQDLPRKRRESWVSELAAARQKYEKRLLDEYEQGVKHSQATNTLHHAVLCKEVHDFLYKGSIDPKQTVTGWGGWTIGNCAARWLRAYRPGQEVNCPYQFSAVGPDLAMMVGAGAAVQLGVGPQAAYKGAPVLVVTSDAGIAYSMFELDTAAKYKIPVVCIVYNNNAWGMWPSAVGTPRAMHMYLFQENLRYDKMAEGLGARGEYVRTQDEFRDALKRSYTAAANERVSSLINVQALKEFTSARNYPPGNMINPEPSVGALAH